MSKPKCVDCNNIVSGIEHKRCLKCSKKWQVGKNASNYKGVSYTCLDCNKKLASMYAKRCQSCAKMGKRNNRYGKIPKHTKRIIYKNNIFRSGWEANFAKWCDLSDIKWKYEPYRFEFENKSYTPDFYLPEFDKYIEIKGHWFKPSLEKFKLFNKHIKNIEIYDKKKLQELGVV